MQERWMAASLGDARRDVLLFGTRPQRIDDVEVLPLARFLEELPP